MSAVTSLLEFCLVLGFHCKVISLAGNISDSSNVLLAWLAVQVLSCCWLFDVLANSFFPAADEGFHSPHAGGCSFACGWSCFSKIIGKNAINPSINFVVLF